MVNFSRTTTFEVRFPPGSEMHSGDHRQVRNPHAKYIPQHTLIKLLRDFTSPPLFWCFYSPSARVSPLRKLLLSLCSLPRPTSASVAPLLRASVAITGRQTPDGAMTPTQDLGSAPDNSVAIENPRGHHIARRRGSLPDRAPDLARSCDPMSETRSTDQRKFCVRPSDESFRGFTHIGRGIVRFSNRDIWWISHDTGFQTISKKVGVKIPCQRC